MEIKFVDTFREKIAQINGTLYVCFYAQLVPKWLNILRTTSVVDRNETHISPS
jgi:hypothetical protein